MKWFSVRTFSAIEEVEVNHATEHFVTFHDGRREKRLTDWGGIFQTREEAKRWRINHATKELEKARRAQDRAEEMLIAANAL